MAGSARIINEGATRFGVGFRGWAILLSLAIRSNYARPTIQRSLQSLQVHPSAAPAARKSDPTFDHLIDHKQCCL